MSNESTSLDEERQRREIAKVNAEIQQIERGHEFEVRRWKAEFYLKVITLASTLLSSLPYLMLKEIWKLGG